MVEPDEFDSRPELLSTLDDLNGFLADPLFETKHVTVQPVSGRTVALLLSDAVGHWCYKALKDGKDDWRFLVEVSSATDFRDFVMNARANRSMKLDDTTLVRLSF